VKTLTTPLIWLATLTVLMMGVAACGHTRSSLPENDPAPPNTSPATGESTALQCPHGSTIVGKAPPPGTLQACQRSDGTRHGPAIRWHENARKWLEVEFRDGKRHGESTEWYSNGQVRAQAAFRDGEAHGLATHWHDNGQKYTEGAYKDDAQEGKWTVWHANGQKQSEGEWKDGKKLDGWTCWDDTGKERACTQ